MAASAAPDAKQAAANHPKNVRTTHREGEQRCGYLEHPAGRHARRLIT
jgi:hypothetical protein